MKKIFVRSPYFIEVNETGQTGAKVELFIWHRNESEPTVPTYTLTQNIASQTQTNITFNISPYALDNIQIVIPTIGASIALEDAVNWVYVKVKRYKIVSGTATLLDTETFAALNGFTLYENGYNQYNDSDVVPLFNTDILLYNFNDTNKYVNVWLDASSRYWYNEAPFTAAIDGVYKLPYSIDLNYTLKKGTTPVLRFDYDVQNLCEPKYTPVVCSYINRFGGWHFLTFFKASKESLETEYKDFKLMPQSVDYNVNLGVTKTFNQQGKKKITCNTGWVDENYFELIEDLMLSDTILIDGKPAYILSKSTDRKTYLRDKNINYTLDFQYAYGVINDII